MSSAKSRTAAVGLFLTRTKQLSLEGAIQSVDNVEASHFVPPSVDIGKQFFAHMRASRKLSPEKAKRLAERFQREFEEEVAKG